MSTSDSTTGFGSSTDNTAADSFNSTAHSISTVAIVSVLVSSLAIIAIVIAIIYCLKKASKSAPYAQFTIGHANQSGNVPTNNEFAVLTNSKLLESATMERFLSEMAKEKPLRFSSQQLKDFTSNFLTRLGSGGFGVVYKGNLPNGVPIAVKVLNSNLGKRVEEQFMAEVATIGRTYHINLVRLYGFCFDANVQALVYEYMENGSLDTLLFSESGRGSTSWKKLHQIALGTAKGISYLHEECQQRIIHYDIKPGNVLLDYDLSPKVADFGLAKLCNRDSTHVALSGIKGTPGYAAPEVWMPYPVTHKCDVYSFGMLLFEIVGRRRNHLGGDMSGTSKEWLPRWVYEKAVERKEVEEMLAEFGVVEEREEAERAVLVALWCVQYLPAARPKMSDVVRMLEGGVGIPEPPNPFAHLVDDAGSGGGFKFGTSSWGSSSEDTNHTFPRVYDKRIDILAAQNATL